MCPNGPPSLPVGRLGAYMQSLCARPQCLRTCVRQVCVNLFTQTLSRAQASGPLDRLRRGFAPLLFAPSLPRCKTSSLQELDLRFHRRTNRCVCYLGPRASPHSKLKKLSKDLPQPARP